MGMQCKDLGVVHVCNLLHRLTLVLTARADIRTNPKFVTAGPVVLVSLLVNPKTRRQVGSAHSRSGGSSRRPRRKLPSLCGRVCDTACKRMPFPRQFAVGDHLTRSGTRCSQTIGCNMVLERIPALQRAK